MRLALALLLIAACAACNRAQGGSGRADVHVFTPWGPASGASVFVHDRNGIVIGFGEADENGEVDVTVEGDEFVSAHYVIDIPEFGYQQVTVHTIAGAEPGDDLFFPMVALDPEGIRGTVSMTVEGGLVAGAASYQQGLAGCPSADGSQIPGGGAEDVEIPEECPGDTFTPFVLATDTAFQPVAYQVAPETALADLVADGVTLPGPWLTDFDLFDYDIATIPAGTETLVGTFLPLDAAGRPFPGRAIAFPVAGVTSTGGTLARIPFTQPVVTQSRIRLASPDGWIAQSLAAPMDASISVDFSDTPLYLTSALIAADETSLQAIWAGAPADAERIEIALQYLVDDSRGLTWTMQLPGHMESPFRFPEWPSEDLPGDEPPTTSPVIDPAYLRFVYGEWDDAEGARTDDPRDDALTANRRVIERRFVPAP